MPWRRRLALTIASPPAPMREAPDSARSTGSTTIGVASSAPIIRRTTPLRGPGPVARGESPEFGSRYGYRYRSDFGRDLRKVRAAAWSLQRGGVGLYTKENFVHVDTGPVRAWPRLPRSELALLFPDGKTKHHPADGGELTRVAPGAPLRKHGARRDGARHDHLVHLGRRQRSRRR